MVTFDDENVVVTRSNQQREQVRWDDLVKVAIYIEQEYFPMPYWILLGRPGKGGCLYPNDAVGAKEMLAELQKRLHGLDNAAVGAAMVMMTGGIPVWERPGWDTATERQPA